MGLAQANLRPIRSPMPLRTHTDVGQALSVAWMELEGMRRGTAQYEAQLSLIFTLDEMLDWLVPEEDDIVHVHGWVRELL